MLKSQENNGRGLNKEKQALHLQKKCGLLLYFKLRYWFVTSWSWIYDSKAIKTHMQEDILTEMDQ